MNPDKKNKFEKWLKCRGAFIMPPTNEYEFLRFVAGKQTGIVYVNKHGKITHLNEVADEAYQAFITTSPWKAPDEIKERRVGKKRRNRFIKALIKRDGSECFFCGKATTDDDRTVEHLLSISDGGRNHLSNLALAHDHCNNLAQNMSIVEKVKLREKLRGEK